MVIWGSIAYKSNNFFSKHQLLGHIFSLFVDKSRGWLARKQSLGKLAYAQQHCRAVLPCLPALHRACHSASGRVVRFACVSRCIRQSSAGYSVCDTQCVMLSLSKHLLRANIMYRHPEEGQVWGWKRWDRPCPDVGIYCCFKAVDSTTLSASARMQQKGRLPQNCIERIGYQQASQLQFFAMTMVYCRVGDPSATLGMTLRVCDIKCGQYSAWHTRETHTHTPKSHTECHALQMGTISLERARSHPLGNVGDGRYSRRLRRLGHGQLVKNPDILTKWPTTISLPRVISIVLFGGIMIPTGS